MSESRLRRRISSLVSEYYHRFGTRHGHLRYKVQYGARVFDEKEILALVDAVLDSWLTYGTRAQRFERQFAKYLGLKHAVFVNSGSSANLLSVAALSSRNFNRRLKPGDEVITPATTFPTTINPLLQFGLKPVLVDSNAGTYNIDTSQLSDAVSKKTRAIMLPHMLGNPADLDSVLEITQKHNLLLVEDACESLGAKYRGEFVGTKGQLSTFSFYAPHHMTTGEGGAVCTDHNELKAILLSLRDWGRASGGPKDLRALPQDYDKRYVYTERGYNMRPLDLSAAVGLVQLRKLRDFTHIRMRNFQRLYDIFSAYEDYFLLPESLPRTQPVWFAFPLTVRRNNRFKRRDIVTWLEKHRIETRSVLAGNITLQPAYRDVRFRKVGKLEGARNIARNSFFIGLYPGVGEAELRYVGEVIREFFRGI